MDGVKMTNLISIKEQKFGINLKDVVKLHYLLCKDALKKLYISAS